MKKQCQPLFSLPGPNGQTNPRPRGAWQADPTNGRLLPGWWPNHEGKQGRCPMAAVGGGGRNLVSGRHQAVGEMVTEDTGVKVDHFEATGRTGPYRFEAGDVQACGQSTGWQRNLIQNQSSNGFKLYSNLFKL
jgi:hypothetical protein